VIGVAVDRRNSRSFVTIMAASAAMIVAGAGISAARAQDAGQTSPASPPPSNGVALVNQLQAMRDQMQQMQGQIEELQHQLQQLQQTGKDQYIDLDSRLGRLEKSQPALGGSAAAPAASAATAATASTASSAPATSARPMSEADKAAAKADFDAAFKALRDGNYVDSARGFRAFIGKYPDSPLVPNAYYWLGSSYQVTQNCKPALDAFGTLLRKYPDDPKAGEAQLRIADCQIALKEFAAARTTLQAVIKSNPGTPLEKRARARMDDLPPSSGKP
jgi:tol-pal system protein YbgF